MVLMKTIVSLVPLSCPILIIGFAMAGCAVGKTKKQVEIKTIQAMDLSPSTGPFSHARLVGNLLYTSGQTGIDPHTGQLVDGGFEEQTLQVLKNLDAILYEAGTSWEKVIKATVFITDMGNYSVFNSIYEKHLKNAKPARSTVQVVALPADASIEIELIAVVG
jgi:2-iminobutanoate/2-iminopropanoate deaminase